MGRVKDTLRYVFWKPGFWRAIPDALIVVASITDLNAFHHAVKQENWDDALSYTRLSQEELHVRLTRLRTGDADRDAIADAIEQNS